MALIKSIHGRQIIDSRGNPTVEVDVTLDDNSFGRASVPSGASTGLNEAIEIRDNDDMFGGKDVKKGLEIINKKIAPQLVGLSCENQNEFDNILKNLDKSDQKLNIGGNVSTALSIANYLCASNFNKEPAYKYHSNSNNNNIPPNSVLVFKVELEKVFEKNIK